MVNSVITGFATLTNITFWNTYPILSSHKGKSTSNMENITLCHSFVIMG